MLYFQADVRAVGLALDVRVNDLPTFEDDGARGGGTLGGGINDSVVDGHNTLSIRTRPAAGRTLPPPEGIISVQISAGTWPAALRPVYAYHWKVADVHAPLPEARGAFNSETRYGQLDWQRAARLTLTPEVESHARSLATRLHAAMGARDLDQTTALLADKTHASALFFGTTAAEYAADQRRHFEAKFGQPGWGVEPLETDQLRFRLYGDGRVVSVEGPRGRAVIRSAPNPEGVVSAVPVAVPLLDGRWVILR